jgi:hypothetical protein
MRSAAGATKFLGDIGPTISGSEDEPNNFQHDSVRNRRSSALGANRRLRRKVVINEGEESTGHAASAFMKSVANGIECGLLAS